MPILNYFSETHFLNPKKNPNLAEVIFLFLLRFRMFLFIETNPDGNVLIGNININD